MSTLDTDKLYKKCVNLPMYTKQQQEKRDACFKLWRHYHQQQPVILQRCRCKGCDCELPGCPGM